MLLEPLVQKLSAKGVEHGEATHEDPRAAVAAILRPGEGEESAELFFIVRSVHPKDPWSGHVAFPGGRRDPEDASLLATAIRETREEVGIELTPADAIARLPDVPAFTRGRRRGLVVSPFVFVVPRDVPVVPHNAEVAATLWVPLAMLAGAVGTVTFELEYDGVKYQLPYVYLEPGQHRLWGMTYGMLMSLLDASR